MNEGGVSVDFYCAIVRALPACGFRDGKLLLRPDVTQALVDLVKALSRPDITVSAGMGPSAWLRTDFVGRSSAFMLLSAFPGSRYNYIGDADDLMSEAPLPRDAGDFSRCLTLLIGVPQVKSGFGQIAAAGGPGWKLLLDRWDEARGLLDDGNRVSFQQLLDECHAAQQRR
jgi:hypothetical protein